MVGAGRGGRPAPKKKATSAPPIPQFALSRVPNLVAQLVELIEQDNFSQAGLLFSAQISQSVRKEVVLVLCADARTVRRAQAFITRPKPCHICHQVTTIGNVIQERLLQCSKDCKAFIQHGFLCQGECTNGPECQHPLAHPGNPQAINAPKKRRLLTPVVDGAEMTDFDRLLEGMTSQTSVVAQREPEVEAVAEAPPAPLGAMLDASAGQSVDPSTMNQMVMLQMLQMMQTMQQTQVAMMNKLQSPGTARERRRPLPPASMMTQLQGYMAAQKSSAAAVMIRPVRCRPLATASSFVAPASWNSLMRASRKTP